MSLADVVEAASDPFAVFADWMKEAEASEPNDPNAVALATATPDGMPSVRMVLMKKVDQRGFCFFTNCDSRKGMELAANPRASMCFHWKSVRRQVRISGGVSVLPEAETDTYFHSRSLGSQRAAYASQQSQPLQDRKLLRDTVTEIVETFRENVPLPKHWKGYVLRAEQIEFWMDGDYRLHDRVLFTRSGNEWLKTRLYP